MGPGRREAFARSKNPTPDFPTGIPLDAATNPSGKAISNTLGVIRLILGFTFFWAFLDKAFGLGWSTQDGWLTGDGNPTRGYLGSSFGPFGDMFQAMAGNGLVNFLFMLGLLGVGAAMLLGMGVRIAAWAGFAMVTLMYFSHPVWAAATHGTNPLLDAHVLEGAALLLMGWTNAGIHLGMGKWWQAQPIVQKNSWLI